MLLSSNNFRLEGLGLVLSAGLCCGLVRQLTTLTPEGAGLEVRGPQRRRLVMTVGHIEQSFHPSVRSHDGNKDVFVTLFFGWALFIISTACLCLLIL